jgi:hypothetical protein
VSYKLLVKDQQGEREVLLIDTVAVGRDPRCDISLADPLLSRRHAEFVASGPTVIVRDLNSRNGILVNGRKLQEAVLRPGDVVQISQMAVTFLSSIDAVTVAAPRPGQRRLEEQGAHQASAGPDSTGPVDEKTSLLTPGEIEAVAAASAARNRPPSNHGTSGQSAAPGNGGKRSGAWSVQVVADDDRTKFVPPVLPSTSSGDVAAREPEPGAAAEAPGPPPLVVHPAVVASPPGGDQAAPAPRASQAPWVAAGILALAILCFTIGVTSTMIWLQPPLTWRWLLVDHAPVAVLLSLILAVAAGVVVVVALRNAMRSAESGRKTPVR